MPANNLNHFLKVLNLNVLILLIICGYLPFIWTSQPSCMSQLLRTSNSLIFLHSRYYMIYYPDHDLALSLVYDKCLCISQLLCSLTCTRQSKIPAGLGSSTVQLHCEAITMALKKCLLYASRSKEIIAKLAFLLVLSILNSSTASIVCRWEHPYSYCPSLDCY